ncbi:Origin recognition complex, subunit 1 [Vanrija albida]|uniref:Origin recognition complex subunit 1 n=1 Tax=Vanrija albida TaxID=181172 RepID=A0ABR3PV48_9TREE
MPVTPRRSTRGAVFTPTAAAPAVPTNTVFTWTGAARPETSAGRVYYSGFSRVIKRGGPAGATSDSDGEETKTKTPTKLEVALPRRRRKPDEEARFAIGDGVVVQVEGGNDGIGMLTALWEEPADADDESDDDDSSASSAPAADAPPRMMAQIHWFFRKEDLPGVMRNVKLEDNEVLLASSPNRPVTTNLPLPLLVRTIPIYSKQVYKEQFPDEERKTQWKGWAYLPKANVFWCARAYDKGARGGKVWKVDIDEWKGRGRAGLGWAVETVQEESEDESAAAPSRAASEPSDASGDEAPADSDEDDEEQAPRKAAPKRKRAPAATPWKRARPEPKKRIPHPKSSSSRLPAAVPRVEDLPPDPYERALRLLHVGATPESLPCREDEYVDMLSRVEEGIESGGGGCLYIAGVPGTGKTATVHAVVKELRRKAEDGELAPFSYVEINGLKIPTPQHAYTVLWETISGQKGCSAKTALRGLEAHFGRKTGSGVRGPRGHTFVVLMDELDQLLTAKQDVVYNFFNWPTMRDSQLFVVAIANRMDLPQHLAAKIKSRLGLQTLLFQPYDRQSLIEIVQSRQVAHPSSSAEHRVLAPDAIALAATKMAGTNGDARRVLDACRRAVEVAMAQPERKPVSARDMVQVLNAMSSSPVALFLRQCSPQQKRLLAALVRCIRREGVPEISWRAVRTDHDALTRSLAESNELLSDAELLLVRSSLVATHALTSAPDAYKAPEDRRLALGMEIGELGRVLMNEGEAWRRALAGI